MPPGRYQPSLGWDGRVAGTPAPSPSYRQNVTRLTRLLILADSGGSNGCHPRAWKLYVQERLSDRFGLEVTICHYPAGCSKWNPIEYRLFSPISINWAGKPLRSLEIMLACLNATTTCTGLSVQAILLDRPYKTGQSATNAQMKALHLKCHLVCPRWNYSFQPRIADGRLNDNTEVVS